MFDIVNNVPLVEYEETLKRSVYFSYPLRDMKPPQGDKYDSFLITPDKLLDASKTIDNVRQAVLQFSKRNPDFEFRIVRCPEGYRVYRTA